MDKQILLRFGAGGETYVHPAVAVAMVLVAGAILLVPRRYVIVPVLTAAFLIPMDQILVVGPFHFQMLRVLILLGWIRLCAIKAAGSQSIASGGMSRMDKAFTLWVICGGITFILLWQESGALINQLGTAYTLLGMFFLLRFLIRDSRDIDLSVRALAYIAVPIAIVMTIETITGKNLYVHLGGVRTAVREMPMLRDYGYRAMASFQHPILAGVFGSVTFPVFLGMWRCSGKRLDAFIVGMCASTIIVITSLSSTPLMAYAAGLCAYCMWPLRRSMRPLRWILVIVIVGLHLVMKAPVWALLGRISPVGGSDGWHRFYVVDQFIKRFDEWYLIGTKDNDSWGFSMWDITNQYVGIGLSSGLISLAIFVAIIVCGFKALGRARRLAEGSGVMESWSWALGAALFANVVAFFGVSYFDQTQVLWCLLLALIAATGHEASRLAPTVQRSSVRVTHLVPAPYF